MLLLKHIATLLHVLTAAAWFGLALRLAAQARTVLSVEQPAGVALAADLWRSVRFMNVFIVLTVVFAYITFGIGAAAYDWPYHVSASLILVLVAVQFFLISRGWKRLYTAVESGGDGEAARKRVAMGVGIGHLLWLVILVLMFWRRLSAV